MAPTREESKGTDSSTGEQINKLRHYPYNGISLSDKGKPTIDPRNMDRSQKLSLCYIKETRHKRLRAVRYHPLIGNSRTDKTVVIESRAVLASRCTWQGVWLPRTIRECFGVTEMF